MTLHEMARRLGGEVRGEEVRCPGPGRHRRDRSLSVRISAASPDLFMALSLDGDNWTDCRDHVRRLLEIAR